MVQVSAQNRGIKHIYHFTRIENLSSIFLRGLLPRNIAIQNGQCAVNDPYRMDGTDAICVSIGYPNYKMWHTLKCNNPDAIWALLVIKADVLWDRDCVFCKTNAASAEVAALSLDQRRGVRAFDAMFDEWPGKERSVLKIPPHYPTNPQAEVLVVDGIPPSYIRGAYVRTTAHQKQLEAAFPNIKFHTDSQWWYGRSDYSHWKDT